MGVYSGIEGFEVVRQIKSLSRVSFWVSLSMIAILFSIAIFYLLSDWSSYTKVVSTNYFLIENLNVIFAFCTALIILSVCCITWLISIYSTQFILGPLHRITVSLSELDHDNQLKLCEKTNYGPCHDYVISINQTSEKIENHIRNLEELKCDLSHILNNNLNDKAKINDALVRVKDMGLDALN